MAVTPPVADNVSDEKLLALLKRLKSTGDPIEIRRLFSQIERAIFHKQFKRT